MKGFFQRVLPGVFGEAADRRQPPRPPGAERRAAAPAADPAPAARPALLAWGARRPLIASDGQVVGFEFRVGEDTQQRLKRRSDRVAQMAHAAATLASARLTAQTGRIGIARLPAEWLAHWLAHGAPAEPGAGIWVALESGPPVAPEPELLEALGQALPQLRASGARLGWEAASPLGSAPDFVLLRQGAAPLPALLDAMQAWPGALQGLPVVATDIASIDDLELALQRGIPYVCGALASPGGAADPKDAVPVPPEVRRVGLLLNQLVTGADTAVLVREIKGDVGLSYRLLRRINTASFAQLGAGASIDQAVMLLGRNELYRWLSLLLVQFAGSRKTSSALQEVALWRSRLLELLAIHNQEPEPGQLFTLGLASMLGLILRMRLADVVDTLNLPPPARDALLAQAGPWYAYLQVAAQIESPSNTLQEALAERFGGVAVVQALSEQAWAWAAEHSDRKGAAAGSPA